MKNVLLIVAILALFVTGCTSQVEEQPEKQLPIDTGVTAQPEQPSLPADSIDDNLVEEDLEASMDGINLDDW